MNNCVWCKHIYKTCSVISSSQCYHLTSATISSQGGAFQTTSHLNLTVKSQSVCVYSTRSMCAINCSNKICLRISACLQCLCVVGHELNFLLAIFLWRFFPVWGAFSRLYKQLLSVFTCFSLFVYKRTWQRNVSFYENSAIFFLFRLFYKSI